jgi:hypothetical protein
MSILAPLHQLLDSAVNLNPERLREIQQRAQG